MRPDFDEERHLYSYKGHLMPSVTELITQAGFSRNDAGFYTEESRTRGTVIHRIVKALFMAHDVGEDDAAFVTHEGCEGYILALQRFVSDKRPMPVLIEEPLGDEDAWYAGTPDFIGGLLDIPYAIVDVKTGAESDWHGIQTEGYSRLAYRELGVPFFRRFGLHLHIDGRYRLVPHPDIVGDAKAFDAALVVYHWLAKHKT